MGLCWKIHVIFIQPGAILKIMYVVFKQHIGIYWKMHVVFLQSGDILKQYTSM
jgi:hypothetical protein